MLYMYCIGGCAYWPQPAHNASVYVGLYTIQSGDGPSQKFVIVCFNNVLMKYYALHIMLFEWNVDQMPST